MKLISRLILIFVSMFFPEMLFRSSRPKVFCKKCIFRNFAKFTGKQNTSGGCLFFWNVHKYYSHFFIFLLPIILFFFFEFLIFFESIHCVQGVQIRSFFWSVFSRIRTECGKIRARKNSAFGHFSRSDCIANWDFSEAA